MSDKPSIEIQYEVCKTCNGTGRNFWFSHANKTKPSLFERLCTECYGLKKRPIQLAGSEAQAVAISAPQAAQDAMKAVLAVAEKKRAAAAEAKAITGEVKDRLERYKEYDQMPVSDVQSLSVGYADDATMPSESNAPDKADPKPD